MPPTPPFDPARIAKTLLRTSRHGSLATLMPGSGAPYSSLVAVANASDGAPLLLISRLAVHTRNIESDRRVSLLLMHEPSNDPLDHPRIMLAGTAARLTGSHAQDARKRYIAVHPTAEAFAGFADFSFVRIEPEGLHLVAGFGRIVDLPREDLLTDMTGAETLVSAEADIVAHLNEEHADTLHLFATRLLGASNGAWRCLSCDPEGLNLRSDKQDIRLWFNHRATSPQSFRDQLRRLADFARQQTQAEN